jgi:hypothetical protein
MENGKKKDKPDELPELEEPESTIEETPPDTDRSVRG